MFYIIIFFGIPVAALVFFIVSLCRFISAKSKNKKNPGTFTAEEVKNRKWLLIISSLIVGVLVAVVIAFIAVISMAVIYM